MNSEKSGIVGFSLRSGIFITSHDLLAGSGICPKQSYTDLGKIICEDFSWKDPLSKVLSERVCLTVGKLI